MNQVIARLRAPLYLVAIVFVVTPIVDIVANVVPLQLGAAGWRFGATGVASNYLISIVFGVALAAAVTLSDGRRPAVLTLSLLGALGALLLLVAALSYVLDVLQLYRDVPPDSQRMFTTGAVKALFKLVTTSLTLGAFAWALFRAARASAPAASAEPAFLVRERKTDKKT